MLLYVKDETYYFHETKGFIDAYTSIRITHAYLAAYRLGPSTVTTLVQAMGAEHTGHKAAPVASSNGYLHAIIKGI